MMFRNLITHAAAVLVLLCFFTAGFFGQTAVAPSATPPLYSLGPITDYYAALPNSSDVLQFRRSERYNIPNPNLPELGDDSEVGLVESPPTHSKKDPMPFDASDVVVVGTVTAGQSYLYQR
jgi:hypothetical protein